MSAKRIHVIVCVAVCSSGSKLLSADGDGQIKCWAMTEHLVNSWEGTHSSAVEGDPIVALSWLHNGVKLALHVEKVNRDDSLRVPQLCAVHRSTTAMCSS